MEKRGTSECCRVLTDKRRKFRWRVVGVFVTEEVEAGAEESTKLLKMGMSKRGEYDTGAIENDVREACSG